MRADAGSGTGGTELLALAVHNPSAGGQQTSSGGAFMDTDLHAALQVTFTAPASGRVLVMMTCVCEITTAASTATIYWTLRDATTNTRQDATAGKLKVGTGTGLERKSHQAVVSGLTAGQSYTWKWSAFLSNADAYRHYFGAGEGPAVLTTWAA